MQNKHLADKMYSQFFVSQFKMCQPLDSWLSRNCDRGSWRTCQKKKNDKLLLGLTKL